jgi:hypothetical protein
MTRRGFAAGKSGTPERDRSRPGSAVSLAVLTVEPWLGRALGMFPPTPMSRDAPGAQPSAVYHLCDELVFDA